ncbi:TPA: cadmium resistance transporter, partial [Streptococcus suis]|nr:cadmium resistance transporter [Streptococcus suis]
MRCFMIQNVVTSIILYSGTAVDLLIILMLFFAKRKSRKDIINIYLGQFLGSVSLILLSLLFAFVLDYIPSKEILGLLGLIPILLGLKVLLLGDSDGEAIAKEGL